MIESREQRRRKSALLHRRKIAIVASVLLVAVLSGVLAFVFTYFKNVIPYTEINTETQETYKYYIKKVNGVYKMYDDDDNLLKQETPQGTSDPLYVTELGTMIYVDGETGEYERRVVPEMLFTEEDIEHEAYLSIFKTVSQSDVISIDVHNTYGDFTICRLYIDDKGNVNLGGEDGDFVLKNAALSAIDQDFMSYITFYAGFPLVKSRLSEPIKDKNGEYSEYGLAAETRTDADGNEYEYTPNYYVLTAKNGVKHKLIIGDALLDKSGYYVQYEDANGVKRDAVYVLTPTDMSSVNGTTFEGTILGPSKNFITPSIIYPATTNDYFDVTNFSVKKKQDDGEMDEIVNFSYIPIEDRTGTILGIHPYVFSDDSFKGYHPHYDNIDATLQKLMNPDIADIAIVAPTKAQRAEYGLMKAVDNGNGTVEYVYDSEYTISFRRKITNTYIDEKTNKEVTDSFDVIQTIYISKPNENGNYYTFTEMRSPNTTSETIFKGIKIDMICEVSSSTLNFLTFDTYDWVYPAFMQIGLDYVASAELSWGDSKVNIKVNNYKEGSLSILDVLATDGVKYTDSDPLQTFGVKKLIDSNGNTWIITPSEVSVYNSSGTELQPQSLKREYNTLGQKVEVLGKPIEAENGDYYYINKDDITIVKASGGSEKILRYHTVLFQRMFAGITGTKIVDSYRLSEEEETALRADSSAHLLTFKLTDTTGVTKTYEFYQLPGSTRKAYIFVDGVGGFYVQGTRVTKMINDIQRFLAGEPIEISDIK